MAPDGTSLTSSGKNQFNNRTYEALSPSKRSAAQPYTDLRVGARLGI